LPIQSEKTSEAEARRALTIDPTYERAHMILAWLDDLRGQGEKAAEEYNKAGILSSEQELSLVHAFRSGGMRGFHMWWLTALQEGKIQAGKAKSFHIAARYASLGDSEQALQFLNKAVQQHDSNLLLCKVNPWFASLRSEDRFQAVLRRIEVPD
jgi:tetratricopeptide (TPR) repeat protein